MSESDTRLSGKKRAAETQLNPDNVNQVEPEEECNEPMVADAAVLATRKIRKVRRPPGMEEPEDRQGGSELSKAFATATSAGGAKPISAAFSVGFGTAAADAPKPKADGNAPPVTFGFGTQPAKAGEEKKATTAPVSFGFGTTPAASTDKKEDKKEGGAASKPFSFGFGTKPAESKPAASSESGSPVGITAKANSGSLNSVFGGGSGSAKESAPPTGGFSFKVPDGCAKPDIEAPKPQTLPGEAEVDLKTGEEGETVKFTATAKLSERQGDSWSQRGTGEMKINQKEGADAKDGNSRLVMRDAATKRALLNCSLKNGVFKIAKSDKNALIFTYVESGDDGAAKTHTYLLKIPDIGGLPGEKAMSQAKELMDAALQA